MKVAMMGSGGVGGFFGGRLAHAGYDVSFVARGAHLEAMRRDGLTIENEPQGNIHVARVKAAADPAEIGRVDLVIVSVKLWDTADAARAIAPMVGPDTGVLSLQNGVVKDDILREFFPASQVMGGVGYVATHIARPGVIHQVGTMQRIVLGEYDGRASARAKFLHEALVKAGVNAELSGDVRRAIWEKYVFLVGLSATTTAMRRTLGPIRANPQTRAFLLDVMREVVAVGRALGVAVPADYADTRLAFADTLPEDMTSSMHHDLERGNPLEVNWLSGGVVELGRKAGVPTPANRAVCDILALHAAGRPAVSVPALTLRAIRAVAVEVPMRHVLGTSRAAVRAAPLMLIDVETEEGVTGRAYLFCYVPAAAAGIASLLADIERRAKGRRLVPAELWADLAKGYTLTGVQGIVRMALAGFDVACWDALAIALGVPLATLLGAAPRRVRAYNSNGLGLMQDLGKLADEAEELLAGGFRAVKLRLGYPTLEGDLAAVRAVRKRIGADVALMVDYNQALGVAEALERGRMLDAEGVAWLEEPIRHDDYRGAAQLARELATPVQIGENFSTVHAMDAALEAQACDLVMPDLERIGGVTGWMRAAGLAAARGVPMSSHLFPEVSAHLLAATPTAHWLEYVDWAAPVLEQPIEVVDGEAVIPDRPGNGLSWNAGAVTRYRMA